MSPVRVFGSREETFMRSHDHSTITNQKEDSSMFSKLIRSGNRSTDAATALDNDVIIQAKGVVKTYRTGSSELTALRGVDFSVKRGEMVAVMGPSGSGKTTLLNILSGLDEATSGQIWLEGQDLATMKDRKRTDYRARRMGFIFQVYNLLPVLNAVENVELPLLVSGIKPSEAREKSMVALETVGLADWAKHRPAELSGGQRQRVTIARSLVNDPAIIWADEPTGALDSHTAQDIIDLMRKLNEEKGLTLVIVTHDPGVGAQTNRIVRMRDGAIEDYTVSTFNVDEHGMAAD
jgi:putative ABC transport system ATP-binding protein